jgi:hypothetical protein
LEDKLTNNRIKCYGLISRMNKGRRIPMVLNTKVKGKHPKGRLSYRREQQVRKDITQKEEHLKKLRRRRSCGKSQTDREAWLSNDRHRVEEEEKKKK